MTGLLGIVLIQLGEIQSWSLVGDIMGLSKSQDV